MTFEEFIDANFPNTDGVFYSIPTYRKIWDAAQKAERDRINNIISIVSLEGNSDQWMDACDRIVSAIAKAKREVE